MVDVITDSYNTITGMLWLLTEQCFGWKFTDYGPTYVAFDESGIQGGFDKTDEPIVNGVLVVLYHENLYW